MAYLFPVQGKCRISQNKAKNKSRILNIATYKENNPVMASEKGIIKRILKINDEAYFDVNFIEIDHENDYVTIYKHFQINSIKVKEGQHVEKGQIIANVGNTGENYYLSWEIVIRNNTRVKPSFYIDKDLTNLIEN